MNVNLNRETELGKGYNSSSLGESYRYYHHCIPGFPELIEKELGNNALLCQPWVQILMLPFTSCVNFSTFRRINFLISQQTSKSIC